MQQFKFHAYRDSEAPGVRREALDFLPYNDDELPAALAWASVAKWGAMYLDARRGNQDALLEAFRLEAERLGFRLEHVYKARTDKTWRFRVEAIAPAGHWSDGLEQAPMFASGQLAQSRLF